MGIFSGLRISGSGLTAQRFRMNVIAGNIANLETTRTPDGGPYTRRRIVLSPITGNDRRPEFSRKGSPSVDGVAVSRVEKDPPSPRMVFDPDHADADAEGYVAYPRIDIVTEMIDMNAALRAYEANVTVLNAAKAMAAKALEIGRI